MAVAPRAHDLGRETIVGTISIALTPYRIKELFMVKAQIKKTDIQFLMDSGCSGNFIHPKLVERLKLQTQG